LSTTFLRKNQLVAYVNDGISPGLVLEYPADLSEFLQCISTIQLGLHFCVARVEEKGSLVVIRKKPYESHICGE